MVVVFLMYRFWIWALMISKDLVLSHLIIAKLCKWVFICSYSTTFVWTCLGWLGSIQLYLPHENLTDFLSMQQLYLAGNQITSLKSLPELPNLEVKSPHIDFPCLCTSLFLLYCILTMIILLCSFFLLHRISLSLFQWLASLVYRFFFFCSATH